MQIPTDNKFEPVKTESSDIGQHTIEEDAVIDIGYIHRYFDLDEQTKQELCKVTTLDFDIFKIQELTYQNELVTTISYIMAKENLFEELDIQFEIFIRFISKISEGYNNVTYHNRTHGTDLAQVCNYLELLKFRLCIISLKVVSYKTSVLLLHQR